MTRQPKRARAVLHAEELDAAVQELLEFGRARGAQLREQREDPDPPAAEAPEVGHLLEEELRAALEDEIVPAVEVEPSTGIVQWELDRELIKKALVGLKLPVLRDIARGRSLETGGSSEDLAAAIARTYRWDEEAIAQLVLDHEPEPSPETGHVDRVFPLVEVPNLDDVERRLSYVAGRYIRVGVARWFVFDDATVSEQSITVKGTVRAYKATVDTLADEPTLAATPSESPAELVLHHDEKVLVARRSSAPIARAALKALRSAVRLRPVGRLAYSGAAVEGAAAAFAPQSLFILDVLANRLRQAGFDTPNLTVARFKLGEGTDGGDEDNQTARRPTLRAVRFEGDYLLDSATACKLLAEEGRALVDVSMTLNVPTSDIGTSTDFPVRVAVDADHAVVMTSFGAGRQALSVGVQRSVVEAVTAELREGFADAARLQQLCERILERAHAETPVMEADMLDADHPGSDDPPVI